MYVNRAALVGGGLFISVLSALSAAAQQADFCEINNGTMTPNFGIEPSLLVRSDGVLDATFQDVGRGDGSQGQPSERLFSFKRTIGALLTSAGIPNTTGNREALVQTMIETLASPDVHGAQVNRQSGVLMPVDDRPDEQDLDPAALLDETSEVGLIPIALFNRFDLAPEDWVHCGEYRIVYARRDPPSIFDRFFLIFEAAVPNPGTGEEGCRVLTEFWAGLGDMADDRERATRLAALYYDGETGHGGGNLDGPVIQISNLGGDGVLGQVRSNQFIDGPELPWQLREWLVQKTFLPEPHGIAFVPNPDNDNPLAELYSDTFASDPAISAINPEALLSLIHGQFFQRFSSELIVNLLPETSAKHQNLVAGLERFDLGTPEVTADTVVVNTIALGDTDMFDEYQSSSDPVDVVSQKAGADIRRMIDGLLQFPTGSAVEGLVDQTALLNRAGASTCGGCHQTATSQPIFAPNRSSTVWPTTLPFVHINEDRQISEALSEHLLPFRRYILARHLCGPGAPDDVEVAAAEAAAAAPAPMEVAQRPLRSMRLVRAVLEQFQGPPADGEVAAAAAGPSEAEISVRNASAAFEAVQATVARARHLEQRVPGAFVQTRRPH